MLIDRSYFFDEVLIPLNKTEGAAETELLRIIEAREPEFLRSLFGYPLYKEFTEALTQEPIPAKFQALLTGGEFTDKNGDVDVYPGLLMAPGGVSVLSGQLTVLTAGGPNPGDPVAGSFTVTVPAYYVGRQLVMERQGKGTLVQGLDYTVNEAGTEVTLTSQLGDEEPFIFRMPYLYTEAAEGTAKKSPIANYVYYWAMAKAMSQESTTGETISEQENSSKASHAPKMDRAWNQMVFWNRKLYAYLTAKKTDFPNYRPDTDLYKVISPL